LSQRRLGLLHRPRLNGIICSGIFLLPVRVFAAPGGLSWAAWFAIGSICLPVGLCFVDWSRLTIPPPGGISSVSAATLGIGLLAHPGVSVNALIRLS
jgi:amino acid transporter